METAFQEAALGTLNSLVLKYNIPYATLRRHVRKGYFEKMLMELLEDAKIIVQTMDGSTEKRSLSGCKFVQLQLINFC
jgi:hypothetical protein